MTGAIAMNGTGSGYDNANFTNDNGIRHFEEINITIPKTAGNSNIAGKEVKAEPEPEREQWGKGVEFLMACIAMSVGLGNVWRFPFSALENGGGAFLIPYLIVLFLVGKPIYYLEMIIGQFSSRGSVKVFDLCPAMRGVGIGQAYMVFILSSYYASLCAIIAYYLIQSFREPLPWSYCRSSWEEKCIDSRPALDALNGNLLTLKVNESQTYLVDTNDESRVISSSELFFVKEVLHEYENIEHGIGAPNWELVLGLAACWACVYMAIVRGVHSSGKASYFLAIFPYVIMIILLGRAVSLPGAANGILYFITPVWSKILDPQVWYAAVTQCFFSLSVCFGSIVVYSSYNKFTYNVYRDTTIITILDTFTSLLAGITIFGILGNLAFETGIDDIGSVVKGGAGLAFISYPDAIAKFRKLPQVFSVMFFLMLFVLAIGSNMAMTSCTVTAIRDRFPKFKQWQCALVVVLANFFIGLCYVTPGGQFILTLVDHFGPAMIALLLAIVELYILGWVYGTNRLCRDVAFMLGRKVGLYWRLCWAIFTPLIMTVILIYFFVSFEPLTYNGIRYPDWAYTIGWLITAFGVLQVPVWLIIAIRQSPGVDIWEKTCFAFRPQQDWGPVDPLLREQYKREIDCETIRIKNLSFWGRIKDNIFN